jgi:hypothetical protein
MAKRSSSQSKVRMSVKKEIYTQEIEELKTTIKFLETYIVKYTKDCENMAGKLQESENSLKSVEQKLENQIDLNKSLRKEISELNTQINSLNKAIDNKNKIFNAKELERENVRTKLLEELNRMKENLCMSTEEVNEFRKTGSAVKKKVLKLCSLAKIPKTHMKEIIDHELPVTYLSSYFSEIPRILKENLRLLEENQRLFHELESNSSSNFKDLIKDSNGLSYFRNLSNCTRPKCPSNTELISNWIPKPINCALEDFKLTHNPIISSAVISLFHKLNEVWQQREHKRLQRQKKKYCGEIASLQKKSNTSEINLKRTQKNYARAFSANKVKEDITIEYQLVSERIIKLVTEFLDITERNFNEDRSFDWLIEPLLKILAEFTDKILSLIY